MVVTPSGIPNYGGDVGTLKLRNSHKGKYHMGSDLVDKVTTQCYHGRTQYDQEAFLAKCQKNHELCVLKHDFVQIIHFIVHTNTKKIHSISTGENFQAFHNCD